MLLFGGRHLAKVSYTLDQAADKIAATGWTNAVATPITYGFRSSDASNPGFVKFTAAQIAAAETALALWSDVANIKFQRAGTGYTNSATMLFSGDTDDGGYAWAYDPISRSFGDISGDVFITPLNGWFKTFANGSYDLMTMIHETGHAIGLLHPGAYDGGNPTYSLNAEYLQDSRQYTVMSYFDAEDTGASHLNTFASTPLLHDIAAVQLLYGANMTTRTGDTVYGFNSTADGDAYRITSATDKKVFAIWDAGGTDTLDFSGYSAPQTIDLNETKFSSVGGLKDNIAIARGVVIEKAIGGSGVDKMYGNGVDNILDGRSGNDTLNGNAGNDTLKGQYGDDTLDGGFGRDFLLGGPGKDTFLFDTTLGGTNIDRVLDFTPVDDTFRLEDSKFTALTGGLGTLAAQKFYTGTAAHDADDRIIYNSTTGELFYDADGTGTGMAIKFAILTSAVKPALSAADFYII